MRKSLITVFLGLLVASVAVSEGKIVRGVVTDNAGIPLPGASIVAPGGVGTVTDADGRYTLDVPVGTTLTASYVSYKSVSFAVTDSEADVDIVLEDDSEFLNEVVVVGYGTQKKENLSGSVAQVNGKQLEDRPITSISQGLQGLMPGVTVTGMGGAPGQDGGTIHIRGIGTLNSSTPYILVDGVETSSINAIDPDDVASISVLKDAASAAIYGYKASNGVILITTKRGTDSAAKVSYSGSVGVQNATMLVERMNSADAAEYANSAAARSGKDPRFSAADIAAFRDGSDPTGHPNTDWYGLAFRPAVQTRHSVNVSGGNQKVRFMASAGYLFQNGVLPNAGRNQFNARANVDVSATKRLTTHLNLAFIQNNYTDASSAYAGGSSDQIIRQLNRIAPWIVNRYSDGSYGTISDGNPIAWLDSGMKVKRDNRNFTANVGFDYQFCEPLVLKVSAAYVNIGQNYKYFQPFIQYNPSKASDPAQLTVNDTDQHRINFDALLDWSQSFGRHNLHAMAGTHLEKYRYEYTHSFIKGFANDAVDGDLNGGDPTTLENSGYSRDLAMVSGFGRLNYDYDGKYLFEANFRADGSSRFAPAHRWGFFPSFSAAWRISQESWMGNAAGWLESLKIRGSWGQLGNQDALSNYYPYLSTYSMNTGYPFDGVVAPGMYQDGTPVPDISWERSTTWGVGVDFALRCGLSGYIDFYDKKTTDIIMDVSVPVEYGLGGYKNNVGAMRNTGIELSLSYDRRFNEDWELRLSGNLAWNRNRILDLGVDSYGNKVDYIDGGSTRNAVGHQVGCYYMYKWSGKFFNSQEEADAYTAKYGNPFGSAFKAGDLVYEDANGDGTLDSRDRVYTETSSMPAITYNLNITVSWRGLDLSMLWQGAGQVQHIFNREVVGEFNGDSGHPATVWKNSWSETNHNPVMPRVFESGASASGMEKVMSTFWLWDTSYLRLKNLQLGYNFPLKRAKYISRLRVYYSAENLLTIHGLPFRTDPETSSERGSSYPLLRTNSLGVNVSF